MILGTAGHIDHGKTALVRALTGVDTDRLPEEKRRGITIELGFAPLVLDGLPSIGVVDVPGHEAFVRTMLAGATGIDLALVVIAADEGVMPQTREHVAILDLLGVRAGVVALTKSDLVDSEWLQLVEADVSKLLAGTSLAAAPIIHCSAITGAGIDSLKKTIAAAAKTIPARASDDLFRLPIDRAFSVKGTGTVVTGTLWSGSVAVEDQVVLLPRGTAARVRGIERHGASATSAGPADRAAIALGGVDREEIEVRGTFLVRAGDPWVTTNLIRADVALQEGAPRLGPRTRVRFHLGTADVGARIVATSGAITPGDRTAVRVALDSPVVARAGDRFVIRSASPTGTIGGGVVTDADPPRRRAKPWPAAGATDVERLAWMVTEAGGRGLSVTALPIRIGTRPTETARLVKAAKRVMRVGDLLFDEPVTKSVERDILARIDAVHRFAPLEPGIAVQGLRSALRVSPALVDAIIAALASRGAIKVTDGIAARSDWRAGAGSADETRADALLQALIAGAATPPSVDELSAAHGKDVIAVLKHLARRGDAIQVATDRFYSAPAVAQLTTILRAALAGPKQLTVSELREKTGLTRKYLIPFLEYCDRQGLTSRLGDFRKAGPALALQPGS